MDLSDIDVPKGVAVRVFSQSVTIQVQFPYRGDRCREVFTSISLPGDTASQKKDFLAALKRNVKAAGDLLGRIRHEINQNTFSFPDYFPDSKNCKKYGHVTHGHKTVEDYLNSFLARAPAKVRKKTLKNYERIINNQLIPEFGGLDVEDLTTGIIRDWVFAKSHITNRKTISNILSPFKQAMDDAVMDRVIADNPVRALNLDRIITVESRQSEYKPDPFTEDEINILLDAMDGQIRNLFQFAFYTGLRTNELAGLTWKKIDFVNREVLVDEGLVEGEMGKLKTADKGVKSRKVLLLDQALDALLKQKAFTFLEGDFVFHHPLKKRHWNDDAQIRKFAWTPAFKRSGLRYRNPYQTRHTYAHMLIRDNENPWWIANQLGHTGLEMLNQHYGGWLEEAADKYTPRQRFTDQQLRAIK